MTSLPLMRTEYWNPSTNTVRDGATAHGESLTDSENYLLPQAQMTGASLFTWGVADGLSVSASPNQPGLTIAPGVALDAAGHLIALEGGIKDGRFTVRTDKPNAMISWLVLGVVEAHARLQPERPGLHPYVAIPAHLTLLTGKPERVHRRDAFAFQCLHHRCSARS
jgi:hypothetical protein